MANKFWKNIGIGFRLMLAVIPAGISVLIVNKIFQGILKSSLFVGLLLLIPTILATLWIYGFFINKLKRWIFK